MKRNSKSETRKSKLEKRKSSPGAMRLPRSLRHGRKDGGPALQGRDDKAIPMHAARLEKRGAEGGAAAIENHQRAVRVPLRPLELFLKLVKEELGLRGDCVAVRLIRDGEMARLNGKYRAKRRSTDVLSFPAEQLDKPELRTNPKRKQRGAFLGDIAISPVVARRNARLLGRGLPEELQILILHGVLHLLGYDHEADRGEMERVELRVRRRLGIG
jgi:probable rRNA maturation factor